MGARQRWWTHCRGSCGGATRRFDGDPIFSRLVAGGEEKGFCDVVLADMVKSQSSYVRNTAIVETELEDNQGGAYIDRRRNEVEEEPRLTGSAIVANCEIQ